MVLFLGFNKKQQENEVKHAVTHNYSDLPKDGLGKSFNTVEVNEPIILTLYEALDNLTWIYSKNNIRDRAKELNASINYMEVQLPEAEFDGERKIKIWFSPLDSLKNSTEIEKELADLKVKYHHLGRALERISEITWNNKETDKEKIGDLKAIAFNAIYEVTQNIYLKR